MKVFKSEKGKAMVLESYDKLASAWGVGKEERYLETRFGRTHVFLTGEKSNPPLLMFHGVGDNSAVMWLLNIQALSRHFYCIAVDTLGGPGKSEPNEHYNKNEFNDVDWINDLVEQLKLDRFNIMGVSHGACLAYLYTLHEKERIKRAVCIEGGIIVSPIKSIVNTLLLAFPEVLVPTRKNMIKIMKKMKPNSDLFEKNPEVVEHMVLVMGSHNQSAMFPHKLEKYDKERGMAIHDRVCFLFGGNMKSRREELMKIMDEDQFSYKILEGVGHGLNHEKPELANQEIIRFLKQPAGL
jgi:pimeloyl-ACP methyl ester carboxylesterase